MQHICLIFRVLWSSFHLQVVLYLRCFHISDDCATINIESKGSSSCTLCIRWIHASSSRKPAQPSKEAVGDVWYCISRETFSEEQWIAPLCNTQILPFCCSESVFHFHLFSTLFICKHKNLLQGWTSEFDFSRSLQSTYWRWGVLLKENTIQRTQLHRVGHTEQHISSQGGHPHPHLCHDIVQSVWGLQAFLQGAAHAPVCLPCSHGCCSRSHFPSSRQHCFLSTSLISWAVSPTVHWPPLQERPAWPWPCPGATYSHL